MYFAFISNLILIASYHSPNVQISQIHPCFFFLLVVFSSQCFLLPTLLLATLYPPAFPGSLSAPLPVLFPLSGTEDLSFPFVMKTHFASHLLLTLTCLGESSHTWEILSFRRFCLYPDSFAAFNDIRIPF